MEMDDPRPPALDLARRGASVRAGVRVEDACIFAALRVSSAEAEYIWRFFRAGQSCLLLLFAVAVAL